MNEQRILRGIAVLVFLLPAVRTRGQTIEIHNVPEGRFADEWFDIHMGGRKIGYAHNTMARSGDRVETGVEFHMKIGRVDQPVTMRMVQRTTETLAGVGLGFESEMDLSQMKTSMRGTVTDGKVSVVTSQFGMDQKQEFPYPKGALMSWGLFREQVLRGFDPGTRYAVKVYAPEMRLDDAVTANITIGAWEDFHVGGKKARGQRLTVAMEMPNGALELLSWVDKSGLPLRSRVAMPGIGDMEMIAVSQQEAMADFVPPELFMATAIKADRAIERDKSQSIRYLLRSKSPGVKLDLLPETPAQKVRPLEDGAIEVTVSRVKHETRRSKGRGENSPDAAGDKDLSEYLESNLMMNIDDPKLRELAGQAAGGAKDPYVLADRLRRFVTDYVTTKSLNVGFATAGEVARMRQGDCSEHGVLLAALGRINGLPSRVAVGLAYVPVFGGQDDIFGYHLWTQFYIDGRWVDFDAALRESECSPIRIAFAVSSLKNAGLADLSLPLIGLMGAIELKIEEVSPRN